MEFSKTEQRDLQLLERMSNTYVGSDVWFHCQKERDSRKNFRRNGMVTPLGVEMSNLQVAFDHVIDSNMDIGDLSLLDAAYLWMERCDDVGVDDVGVDGVGVDVVVDDDVDRVDVGVNRVGVDVEVDDDQEEIQLQEDFVTDFSNIDNPGKSVCQIM